MNNIVFALDLDFTLSHFVNDGLEALHQIFADQGINPALARETREEIEKTGFSFERYIQALEEKTGTSLPVLVLKPKLNQWLSDHLRLYDDTKEFLDRATEQEIPICIVTFGENIFQRQKILNLRMPGSIKTCGPAGEYRSKPVALQTIIERRETMPRILFLDDSPAELERVEKTFPPSQVRCVRMCREDGPHTKTPYKGSNYDSVKRLDQVWNLVRNWR